MRKLLVSALAAAALLPCCAFAKGEGMGLWMEGQVSEVRAEGRNIHLTVTGRFLFTQVRGQEASTIEVLDLRGGTATIPATLIQGNPFFAMVGNWRGGAIRQPGALLEIVRAASSA